MTSSLTAIIARRLPRRARVFARRHLLRPARFGSLRRTSPLSHNSGYDRGTPVDRYYIEQFLREHQRDIRGRALEIKSSEYSERFGHAERHDVLDIDPANPWATIVADLATADSIADASFDSFVLTQTLQLIYDTRAALLHGRRVLRPGGTLLVTVPGITRDNRQRGGRDYWRFTIDSCGALFSEIFGADQVSVRAYGNVLAAIAFLAGVAQEELTPQELDAYDSNYPVIIGVRAVKPA